MKPVTIESVCRRIAQIESAVSTLPGVLKPSVNHEFELSCLRMLLASLTAEPAVPTEPPRSKLLFCRDLPISVVVNDEVWKLHAVNFIHDGREFSVDIYATSREHAEVMVTDIRETATLADGEIVAFSREVPDETMFAELELMSGASVQ